MIQSSMTVSCTTVTSCVSSTLTTATLFPPLTTTTLSSSSRSSSSRLCTTAPLNTLVLAALAPALVSTSCRYWPWPTSTLQPGRQHRAVTGTWHHAPSNTTIINGHLPQPAPVLNMAILVFIKPDKNDIKTIFICCVCRNYLHMGELQSRV